MTESVINKCKQAVNFYLAGNSLTKTRKKFKVRASFLSQYLKSIGIEVINHQNIPRMNENIFEKIDTEEKAYWLGFLYADGYVEYEGNGIELSLQLSDKIDLEKFNKFIQRTDIVKSDSYRCRVCFRNKKMHSDLIKLGCTPRKSLTLTFPSEKQVPRYLTNHFLRGYVDGDGCLYISRHKNSSRTYPALNILGTEKFLLEIQNIMNWKKNKIYKKKDQNARTINYSGFYVLNMVDKLYKDSTIYLDRKYKKYLLFKKMYLHQCPSLK